MFRKRSTDGLRVPSIIDCFLCRSGRLCSGTASVDCEINYISDIEAQVIGCADVTNTWISWLENEPTAAAFPNSYCSWCRESVWACKSDWVSSTFTTTKVLVLEGSLGELCRLFVKSYIHRHGNKGHSLGWRHKYTNMFDWQWAHRDPECLLWYVPVTMATRITPRPMAPEPQSHRKTS